MLHRWYHAACFTFCVAVQANGNRYPLPNHKPKFLGVVFARVGARGAVRPYNQYQILLRCYDAITNRLMPAAAANNMALEPEQYQAVMRGIANFVSGRPAGGASRKTAMGAKDEGG